MKKKEVVDLYFELLTPFLKEHGFKPKKGDVHFTRKTEYGFDRISISIVHYKWVSESWIKFYFLTRHDVVEDLVNVPRKTFEKAWHDTTTTNVSDAVLRCIEDKSKPWAIVKHENDILQHVSQFKDFYLNKVSDHFVEFSDLRSIMAKYHEDIETAWDYCGPFMWQLYYIAICYVLNDRTTLAKMPDQIIDYVKAKAPAESADRRLRQKEFEADVRNFAEELLERLS